MIKIITHTKIDMSEIRCVSAMSTEIVGTFFTPIHTLQVKLDMCADMRIRLHAAYVILVWC